MLSSEPCNLKCLYDAHAPSLHAFVLNLARNESDTHDVLQTLFCRLAAKPSLLRGVENERAFLLRMARNLFIDSTRRNKVRHPSEKHAQAVPLFAAAEDPDEEAFRKALNDALSQLPEDQRTVAHLKLWERMTFAQISQILGIPANTAASRYRYAIDKLQTLLRPIYEEIR